MHYFSNCLTCTLNSLVPLFFHPNQLNTSLYPNQFYLTMDPLSRARLPNIAHYKRTSLHNADGHCNTRVSAGCSMVPCNPPVLQSPSFSYRHFKPNHSLLWSIFVHWGECGTLLGLNPPSNSSSSSSGCENSDAH